MAKPAPGDYPTLTAADKRFIDKLAKARDLPPDYVLHQVAPEGSVVGGRIVKLSISSFDGKQLDLGALDAAEEVRVAGRELAVLTLGKLPRLGKLDVQSCKLAELDLRGCPALTSLNLDDNRFAKLPALPAGLRALSCARNPLRGVALRAARLESLDVNDCGLTALDLAGLPALAKLDCAFNQLGKLDFSRLAKLESLWCQDNSASPKLPAAAPLTQLSMGKNPLASFDAGRYPLLELLFVGGMGLTSLRLANPKLGNCDCEGNRLKVLDLTKARALRTLEAAGNPLTTLDLTPLGRLRKLTVDDGVKVRSTTLQDHVLPPLRARAGLPPPTKTLAKMDAYQLHAYAESYNWDDGEKRLLEVIRHPRCQLATALHLYWHGQPAELAGFKTAKDAPRDEKQAVELLREIEKGVKTKRFKPGDLPFDPRDVNGTDMTDPDPRIPPFMRQVLEPG